MTLHVTARNIARKGFYYLSLCLMLAANSVGAQGILETPSPGSFESGIGFFRGWHCNAGSIAIAIDDALPIPAAYGTRRADTIDVCGDANNGFILLYNFNLLSDGAHTVRALVDGMEFASTTFTVTTLGQEYIRGLSSDDEWYLVSLAKRIRVSWVESKQNFVITETQNLPVDPDTAINAFVKTWSGNWVSPTRQGTMSFTVDRVSDALQISRFFITGVGSCPGEGSSDVLNPNNGAGLVTLNDGSLLKWQIRPAADFASIGGVFVYLTGPCAGLAGAFSAL
jgi:hypothetical protein